MEEENKKGLSLKQRSIALVLIVIGILALITPFTPGSWLALIGLGILLGKSPKETWVYLIEKWRKFWKREK